MRPQAGHYSDIGDRDTNQDCADVFAAGRVFVIADGMGGHRGGGVASRLVVDEVRARLDRPTGAVEVAGIEGELTALFNGANERLMGQVREDPDLWGLGTTLTVGVFVDDRLHFGHVGDSRLYLWRDGNCRQLTQDHTRADELARSGVLTQEQAARSPQRNVLTRHLGAPRTIDPQLGWADLQTGDRLLLCSDGLYTSLAPECLRQLLAADGSPGDTAAALVTGARKAASEPQDNITALVVTIDG